MSNNILPNFFDFKTPKPRQIIEGKNPYIFNIIYEIISFFSLDSSNYNVSNENCPICYEPIYIKVRPSACSHYFCLRCILEWSRFRNQCPLCRKRFLYVI